MAVTAIHNGALDVLGGETTSLAKDSLQVYTLRNDAGVQAYPDGHVEK